MSSVFSKETAAAVGILAALASFATGVSGGVILAGGVPAGVTSSQSAPAPAQAAQAVEPAQAAQAVEPAQAAQAVEPAEAVEAVEAVEVPAPAAAPAQAAQAVEPAQAAQAVEAAEAVEAVEVPAPVAAPTQAVEAVEAAEVPAPAAAPAQAAQAVEAVEAAEAPAPAAAPTQAVEAAEVPAPVQAVDAIRLASGEVALTIPSALTEVTVGYSNPTPVEVTVPVKDGVASLMLPASAKNVSVAGLAGEAAGAPPVQVDMPPLRMAVRENTPAPTPTTPAPTPTTPAPTPTTPAPDADTPPSTYSCMTTDWNQIQFGFGSDVHNPNWWNEYCNNGRYPFFAQATFTISECKIVPDVGTVAEVTYTFPTGYNELGRWGRTDVTAHGIVPGSAKLDPTGNLVYTPRTVPVTGATTTVTLPYAFPILPGGEIADEVVAGKPWKPGDRPRSVILGGTPSAEAASRGSVRIDTPLKGALSWKPTDRPYRPAAFEAKITGAQPGDRIAASIVGRVDTSVPFAEQADIGPFYRITTTPDLVIGWWNVAKTCR